MLSFGSESGRGFGSVFHHHTRNATERWRFGFQEQPVTCQGGTFAPGGISGRSGFDKHRKVPATGCIYCVLAGGASGVIAVIRQRYNFSGRS